MTMYRRAMARLYNVKAGHILHSRINKEIAYVNGYSTRIKRFN